MPTDEAELRAFRAPARGRDRRRVYVVSLSFRTITYKALCAADQLGAFYLDLRRRARGAVRDLPPALLHQHEPQGAAQPFRVLCHNGEINTIEGNVRAMRGREARLGLDGPALEEDGSDSAPRQRARAARPFRPRRPPCRRDACCRAWQHDEELDEEARSFHRYHAGLVEPWDGPAAVVFTDGRVVGAALDRNGLRPLRSQRLPASSRARPRPARSRFRTLRPCAASGSGQLFAVDPGAGVERDGPLLHRLARRRPYGRWLKSRTPFDPGTP